MLPGITRRHLVQHRFPAVMSAFAALAEPNHIHFLRNQTFVDSVYRRCGQYRVKLFVSPLDQIQSQQRSDARLQSVFVDDWFPATSTVATTGAVPLFIGPASAVSSRFDNGQGAPPEVTAARVVGRELWPMILEKALAKVHGCYAALRRLSVRVL